MKRNVDVLLVIFILGVILGSILTVILDVKHELVFETNSYIIAAKAFISSICLFLVVTNLSKNVPYLLLFIFLLGLINGYIFLMLFRVYSFIETFYRTILYLILLYLMFIVGAINKKRKDNRLVFIFLISAIYGLLSYFFY